LPLFELLDTRALLLVFPNTFEYFFIAYEIVRLRFEPSRFSARLWLATAVAIWVVVKLPQEYWIHVAQGDFTDAVRGHAAVGVVCVLVVAGLIAVFQFAVRPRLPAPDWGWRLAAGPLALPLGQARARHAAELRRGSILWARSSRRPSCSACSASSSPRSCRTSTRRPCRC